MFGIKRKKKIKMPEHIKDLIWIEINKCDTVEEKRNLLQSYINELDKIDTDIWISPWDYE